jgi:hypothetical protein
MEAVDGIDSPPGVVVMRRRKDAVPKPTGSLEAVDGDARGIVGTGTVARGAAEPL